MTSNVLNIPCKTSSRRTSETMKCYRHVSCIMHKCYRHVSCIIHKTLLQLTPCSFLYSDNKLGMYFKPLSLVKQNFSKDTVGRKSKWVGSHDKTPGVHLSHALAYQVDYYELFFPVLFLNPTVLCFGVRWWHYWPNSTVWEYSHALVSQPGEIEQPCSLVLQQ